MESEFLSNGNSILLFSCLWKLLLALISVSTRKLRISLKITFPIDAKKLSGVSGKWRKKMVSNSREISCPIARISFFFENCFLLISIMVSTSRKIVLIKKQFSLDRNSISTNRILDLLKNTFPLNRKAASTLKNLSKKSTNWCPLAEIWFVFKNWLSPNFNNSFCTSRKKTRNETILFSADKKLVSISRNKGPVEKYMFQLKEKLFYW